MPPLAKADGGVSNRRGGGGSSQQGGGGGSCSAAYWESTRSPPDGNGVDSWSAGKERPWGRWLCGLRASTPSPPATVLPQLTDSSVSSVGVS